MQVHNQITMLQNLGPAHCISPSQFFLVAPWENHLAAQLWCGAIQHIMNKAPNAECC